ncbi:MAG: glycosyltransferase [Actinomycetota bacterium]
MSRRNRICALGVVVPAHNEAATIAECLDAIRASWIHLRRTMADPPSVRVVVVLDACTDDTARIARAAAEVQTVTVSVRQVGAARAAGATQLMRDGCAGLRELWLANTDADSVVPVDWLSGMVRAARAGAHVVLGTALPAPHVLSRAAERAWQARHDLRDGHPHVHGANLGIRADAYLALGGWTAVASGEDAALARRASETAHLRVLRTAAIPVRTSARTVGRAPHGFAAYLRDLTATAGTAG